MCDTYFGGRHETLSLSNVQIKHNGVSVAVNIFFVSLWKSGDGTYVRSNHVVGSVCVVYYELVIAMDWRAG